MYRSLVSDKPLNIEKLAQTNAKVDAEKIQRAREQIRMLRDHGVSDQGYELAPPFRRQVYVQSKHNKVSDHPTKA